jgi:exopolysaccharide biosynthesis polyprenyl glycosylphosphotransferase
MIRRHHAAFLVSAMLVDGAAAMATFVAVSILRFGPGGWRLAWAHAGIEPLAFMGGYAAAWIAVLWVSDLYRLRARWSVRREVLDVVRAGALLAFASFGLLYALKLPEVSRLFLLALFPAQVLITILLRLVLRATFGLARERGLNRRNVLIVGTGPTAIQFADRIERHRELGLRVIGHLRWRAPERRRAMRAVSSSAAATELEEIGPIGRPILGDIDAIEAVLHAEVVDEVAICLPPAAWGFVEPIAGICLGEGLIVRIPLVEGGLALPGGRVEDFDDIRILSLVYGPDRALSLVAKRLTDVVLSALALAILSPLLAAVGLLIRLSGRGPVLFSQERVGLHGRAFRVLKFRTMVPDAESRLDELMHRNEVSGHAFKLTRDPRLTRTGRWLRRASIDELPQLWNVLIGDMSIVGPRPPLPREVAGYNVWHRRRLAMKPGITGLWQVSARRDADFDRWVQLDLDYIARWSLWLDLKIMFRTMPAMLQGR